jgi:ribosomal protein S12 methylthiotransferase accessory factor
MMTAMWHAIQEDRAQPGYAFGTRRAVSPAATLQRVRPLLRPAGITRLADVTGLDWIGLPVYQAIRPASRVLAVAQGKGLTRAQAKVSDLMESLEGFHAEEVRQPTVVETVGSMRRRLPYDPYALPLSTPTVLRDALPIDWLAATDLCTGAPTWVPKGLCQLDFRVRERLHVPLFRASSNGLASGNTIAEAVVHGLCELIERDACRRRDRARFDPERSIDPSTISSRLARRILDRFERAGMELAVVDMSGPTSLPCFEVWLDHPDGPGLMRGAGCHPARLTALLRALTEAAQSRLTYIAGSRDDLSRRMYRPPGAPTEAHKFRPASAPPRRAFQRAPTLPPRPFGDEAREIAARVRAVTGMPPLAVDLTRPDFGLPVVFAVAPGLGARPIL